MVLEVGIRTHPCQVPDCGGTIIHDYERRYCHFCSRDYDDNGELIVPPVGEKKLLGKYEGTRRLRNE